MVLRLFVFILVGVFLVTSASAQKKIFISSDGNDGANGSLQHPVASVQKAIFLATQTSLSKVEIYLRKGKYYIDSTIIVSAANLKGKSLLLSSFNNEEVVISGAKKITVSWNKYKNNIYVADVSIDFIPDAMFANGKQQVMARYPNYDSAARIFNGVAADAISEQRVMKWKDPTGGFFMHFILVSGVVFIIKLPVSKKMVHYKWKVVGKIIGPRHYIHPFVLLKIFSRN